MQDMTAAAWGASSAALPHAPAGTAASSAVSAALPPHAVADAPLPHSSQAAVHTAEPPLQAGSAAGAKPVPQPRNTSEPDAERRDPPSGPADSSRITDGGKSAAGREQVLQLRPQRPQPQRPTMDRADAEAGALAAAPEAGQAGTRMQQEPRDGAGSSGGDGREQQHRRPKQAKLRPAVIPHIAALGALVGALARSNEVDAALRLYAQARASKENLPRLGALHATTHAAKEAGCRAERLAAL